MDPDWNKSIRGNITEPHKGVHMPYQLIVNGENYGPWRWSLCYAQDILLDLKEDPNNTTIAVMDIETNLPIYRHPNPFNVKDMEQS